AIPRSAQPSTVAVTIDTEPPGAAIAYIPLDGKTGEPLPEQGTNGQAGVPVDLVPGHYLVVAVLEGEGGGGRFHAVFRRVPGDGDAMRGLYRHQSWKPLDNVIHLERIPIPNADVTRGMCLFPSEKKFVMGSAELKIVYEKGELPLAPPHRRSVPAFWLD